MTTVALESIDSAVQSPASLSPQQPTKVPIPTDEAPTPLPQQKDPRQFTFNDEPLQLIKITDKTSTGSKTYLRCYVTNLNTGKTRHLWIERRDLPEADVSDFLKKREKELEKIKQSKMKEKHEQLVQKFKDKQEKDRVKVKVYRVSQESTLGGFQVKQICRYRIQQQVSAPAEEKRKTRKPKLYFTVQLNDGTMKELTRNQVLQQSPQVLLNYYWKLLQEKQLNNPQ